MEEIIDDILGRRKERWICGRFLKSWVRVFGGGEGKGVHPEHDDRHRIGIMWRKRK